MRLAKLNIDMDSSPPIFIGPIVSLCANEISKASMQSFEYKKDLMSVPVDFRNGFSPCAADHKKSANDLPSSCRTPGPKV